MRAAAYLLPRPPLEPTREKLRAFEDAWRSRPSDGFADYRLAHPKWQFLSFPCEAHELVLHGSQNHDIGTVEPRQAHDARAFGNQRAVHATTDGIWVIFFAILDRLGHPGASLFNTCLQAEMAADRLSDPLYFFSVTHSALVRRPWCEGTVYVLPPRALLAGSSAARPGPRRRLPALDRDGAGRAGGPAAGGAAGLPLPRAGARPRRPSLAATRCGRPERLPLARGPDGWSAVGQVASPVA